MSRVFEFRAWSETYNKFIDLNAVTEQIVTANPWCRMSSKGIFLPLEDHIKLQQFTGLFDKNKKKIFEGDIVKVDRCHTVSREISKSCYTCDLIEDGTEIAYIYFGNVEWLMSFDHIRHDDIQKMMDVSHRLEIIGNIFENPELVKYN